MSKNGMGPHRHPAGVVDQRDGVGHGGARAGDVGARAGDQVGGEDGGQVVDPLVLQARLVGRVPEHRAGEVGAPQRPAGGAAGLQRRVVELEAQLAQPLGHGEDPPLAVRAGVLQRGEQAGVPVVDPVAEDVQVLIGPVHRGDLHRGNETDPRRLGGRARLVDPVHRVVVGERQQLDPRPGGRGDHLGRRELPVRDGGMRLQIEGGRLAHGAASCLVEARRAVATMQPDPRRRSSAGRALHS